jgi:hypothetical protein
MANLLNDEQKLFRVHWTGAGEAVQKTWLHWNGRGGGGVCFEKSFTGRGEAGWRILLDGPRGASIFHASHISDSQFYSSLMTNNDDVNDLILYEISFLYNEFRVYLYQSDA